MTQDRSYCFTSRILKGQPNGEKKAFQELDNLKKRNENDKNWINKDLFRMLRHIEIWVSVYQKLSTKQGATTSGADNKTIDGTSLKTLKILRDAVLTSKFKWGEIRRTYIPKPNGKERPLGIPTFQDRLVQGVIKTILENIYEPAFKETSYGFRPGRSQITALREVRKNFGGVIWIVEGDITKCYDMVQHQNLTQILEKRISDKRFLELIAAGLKARIVLPEGKIISNDTGVPQGGVLSPLLSNIYLHELDQWMEEYKQNFDKGTKRGNSLEYNRLVRKPGKAAEAHVLKVRKTDPMDKTWRRVHYARYADDFIVGMIGEKQDAIKLKEEISKFLKEKLGLELNQDKTKITHWKQPVPFLGYTIGYKEITYKFRVKGTYRAARRRILTLMANVDKVVKKLSEAKFCDLSGDPKPCFQYMHQPQSLTNVRIRSIILGLCNYYRLANNRRRFTKRIAHILRHSLAKMYAAKYRLHSRAKVFRIAGKNLNKPLKAEEDKTPIGGLDEETKSWFERAVTKVVKMTKEVKREVQIPIAPIPYAKTWEIPQADLRTTAKNPQEHFEDPILKSKVFYTRGIRALGLPCVVCGTTEEVEMHHIRRLADLKGKTPVEKAMSSVKRKQIPLCRKHHLEEHGKG